MLNHLTNLINICELTLTNIKRIKNIKEMSATFKISGLENRSTESANPHGVIVRD